MVLIYLFSRFVYRIKEFARHWYIKSFFIYSHFIVSLLEKIDSIFAFKITLRNLFRPLYGDYSVLGYIFGFIFRSVRLVVGGAAHLLIIVAAAILYFIWLVAPIYIIYRIIKNGI